MELSNGNKKLVKGIRAALATNNLEEAIDLGWEMDQISKAFKTELDALKIAIRAYARDYKVDEVPGLEHVAKLSPNDTGMIEPKKLYALCKKEGILSKFWDLIKVQMGDTRKLLGDLSIKNITIMIPGEKKVSFK